MLKLTNQIKKEILKYGLNLEKTIKEIETIAQTMSEEVNHISISRSEEKETFLYFIVYDELNNNCEYLDRKYNNNHCWKIKTHKEKNIKKLLFQLVQMATNEKDFIISHKPQSNYKIVELANNKPLTLLKAKNDQLVNYFVIKNCGEWLKINEININEDKKSYIKNFFNINNNYWDAETVRKEADAIFAVYNPKYKDFLKFLEEKHFKICKRRENKPNKATKRYFYSDKSFLRGLLDEYQINLYNGFSHNSLNDHKYDKVEAGFYIQFNGVNYPKTTEPTTRQEVFKMLVDRSGYFVFAYRHKLKERAKQLKSQREQEKKEQDRQTWKESDHTNQEKEINNILQTLKGEILKRSNFSDLLDGAIFDELKKLRELYINISKQLNFTNYNSFQDWEEHKNSKLEELDFYSLAISRGVFSRLACFHHYEKTATGYKIKDTEKDPFWRDPSRYIQEF